MAWIKGGGAERNVQQRAGRCVAEYYNSKEASVTVCHSLRSPFYPSPNPSDLQKICLRKKKSIFLSFSISFQNDESIFAFLCVLFWMQFQRCSYKFTTLNLQKFVYFAKCIARQQKCALCSMSMNCHKKGKSSLNSFTWFTFHQQCPKTHTLEISPWWYHRGHWY